VKHGIDGWELEDMEWDLRTGVAEFRYFHFASFSERFVTRPQPTRPGHVAWAKLGHRPQRVLTLQ
jgi:hypothetical protein